jgi:hypothetical protein
MAVEFSTLIGGSGMDYAGGIALGASGTSDVYITGITNSPDFPTINSLMPNPGGATASAFVARLRGSSFDFSSYLGGSGQDFGSSVVAAPTGEAWVSGWTNSVDFPIVSPYRATPQGNSDIFVSRILFPASAPRSVSALSGDGLLAITFSPPATTGGSSITGYTVTCNPGGIVATGTTSPIVVTGLTNGTQYSCTITATTAVGVGSSATLFPTPAAPVGFQNVTSSKLQGASGSNPIFIDTSQPIGGSLTVEPRLGTQSLTFNFTGPVYPPFQLVIQDAQNNLYGTSNFAFSATSVSFDLNVPGGKRVTVTFLNMNNTGNTLSASFAVLAGDVNGSQSVTASDILMVKGYLGVAVLGNSTQYDVNNTGDITSGDVDAVKANSGTQTQ